MQELNKKIKTTAWFKKAATSSNLFEEPTVYSNQIKDWIKNEAKKMDLILSDEGLNLIASRNEENLLSAFQELKFLKCLDRKDTGYEFVRDSSEYHVFSLANKKKRKTKTGYKATKGTRRAAPVARARD